MIIKKSEQGSFEWLQEKIGVIGGTRISSIITPAKLQLSKSCDDLILKLIDEKITGLSAESVFFNDAMARGIELEAQAFESYQNETGIKIAKFGLCLSDKNEMHGLSPDAFTPDFIGGVEIKCPGGVKHLKYINNDDYPEISIFSDYKTQCLNYFIVNPDLQWLDTVSFRPEFYPKPIHIVRIKREGILTEISKVEIAINDFFDKFNIMFDKYTF